MFESKWIDKLNRNLFPFVEYPGYDQRYPAHTGIGLSKETTDTIRNTSEELFKIFAKAVKISQQGDTTFFTNIEIPEKLWPYLNIPNVFNQPTFLSRFDFVLDKDMNIKMVEINADTPCAIIESYYGNEVYCTENNKKNVNEGEMDNLANFLMEIYKRGFYPTVDFMSGDFIAARPFVFSCFDDYIEDYGTTKFLMLTMQEACDKDSICKVENSIRFESFYNLKVDKNTGDILLPNGDCAGALYRLHQLEILIDEESDDGYPIGTKLLDGYKNNKFLMFNPPEAILMQSKAFQSLIWNLAFTNKFYTEREEDIIKRYLPPSYFSKDEIPRNMKYVEKPIWGREGLDIKIMQNNNIIFEKEVEDPGEVVRRLSKNKMYQQYIDQPKFNIRTDEGSLSGYITLSCFMLFDKASALYARFSEDPIAGTEAYWVPLYVK